MGMSSSVETLVRLNELRSEKEKRDRAKSLRESYGIHFYRPHAKQDRFHQLGNVTGRYARFANRTGKTVCGAAEDVSWCLGGRVFYRQSFDVIDGEGKVVRQHVGTQNHEYITKGIPQHPVKGLLVCSDWDKAKEIFTNRTGSYENWGDLFQLIPREAVGKPHVSRGGHVDMIPIKRPIEFGGGESLLYLDTVESFKHAWRSAESSDFDFIHYDEPPPQQMFIANKRGLTDRNGKFWINATPVEEQWINDEFSPPHKGLLKVPVEGLQFRKTERGGERFVITASIYENPYINAEGRNEFEASLNREERQCRLFGIPMNLAGLVYKEFVYDLHVLCDVPKGWETYDRPPKDYTIRDAWDVHDAIPQAVLLVATAPNGEVFVYDEIFEDKLINVTADTLKHKVADYFVCDQLIDPRAVIESPVTDESILDELAKYDLYFDMGSKDMMGGISKVREHLQLRTPTGMPRIWFSPNLTQTLFEIQRYCYNPKTQKPIDKDDHMLENLRRLLLHGVEYVDPPKSETPKPKPFVIPNNIDLAMSGARDNLLR
jgi:hypothetical protein